MGESSGGIYKISFEIKINSSDNISPSDVAQSLTEELGEDLVSKISHLSIEKVTKKGKSPQSLKIGDAVRIIDNVNLRASFYEDDGYLFIGEASEISNKIGSKEIVIEAGSIGFINQIFKNGEVEIIDIDRPITASLRVDDLGTEIEETINVDLISLKAEQIEKYLPITEEQ